MDDVIDRRNEAFRTLIGKIELAATQADALASGLKPSIGDRRYLSGDEICRTFHIGKRTLQDYRDQGVIPYTSIGGKILYPESELEELLARNFVPARNL